MASAKRRTDEHVTDSAGEQLLRDRLPTHWVLRPYRPDYGLDFALEVFAPSKTGRRRSGDFETLGEHLFIQLKTTKKVTSKPLKIFGRHNVEKQPEKLNKGDHVGTLCTVRFQLDSAELVTVERMGVAIPVLLVVADLTSRRCHFVCLNDYIDKILVPRHGAYHERAARTIHVPLANEVGDPTIGASALRWYAKRPKLYAAFQRFVFQEAELQHAFDSPGFFDMARYFARRIAEYDFWEDTEMWELIGEYGHCVKQFLSSEGIGIPGMDLAETGGLAASAADVHSYTPWRQRENVLELWRRLALLPRNYEDINREWFLPTGLGCAASYPTGTT